MHNQYQNYYFYHILWSYIHFMEQYLLTNQTSIPPFDSFFVLFRFSITKEVFNSPSPRTRQLNLTHTHTHTHTYTHTHTHTHNVFSLSLFLYFSLSQTFSHFFYKIRHAKAFLFTVQTKPSSPQRRARDFRVPIQATLWCECV